MQNHRGDLREAVGPCPGSPAERAPRRERALLRRLALTQDVLVGAGLALAALALYLATLLPGIGNRDTAEFQWVVPTLGLAHSTGYPLYTILGWLWSHLPLGGTPAWRMNMFSAVSAALAIGVVFRVARELGQRLLAAVVAAACLATSLSFWSQATIAEVYGLSTLLQALLLLALLRWRAGVWPLWVAGLLLGLGLAHHRSVVLMLPGALLFLGFETWRLRRGAWGKQPSSSLKRQTAYAMLATLAGCLLYLYVPLRAPAWMRTWQQVGRHIAGSSLTAAWLDPARLASEWPTRLLDLAQRFVWPQLLPAGALLALLGAGSLLWRDRASAALIALSYLATVGFCAAYYVADVEVFFIPAHLLAALLLGEGASLLVRLITKQSPATADHQPPTTDHRPTPINRPSTLSLAPRPFSRQPSAFALQRSFLVGVALLALPVLLLSRNLPVIRTLNTLDDENAARGIMAQPLPPGALVVGNWRSIEGPLYLQVVEGLRTDVQFGLDINRPAIVQALQAGRAVYLIEPDLALGLAQWPEGRLWRVGSQPIAAVTPTDIRWEEGLGLAGYTLRAGPYRPGDIVPIMLEWQALDAPAHDYTLFVHLIGPDGAIWGQCDAPPVQAPTSKWERAGRYVDLLRPVLWPGAPPGRYHVNVGWYEYPAMRRLALAGQPAGADFVTLGDLVVVPGEQALR